mgnify:CR=1 FL=1
MTQIKICLGFVKRNGGILLGLWNEKSDHFFKETALNVFTTE